MLAAAAATPATPGRAEAEAQAEEAEAQEAEAAAMDTGDALPPAAPASPTPAGEKILICGALWTPPCHLPCHITVL